MWSIVLCTTFDAAQALYSCHTVMDLDGPGLGGSHIWFVGQKGIVKRAGRSKHETDVVRNDPREEP